MTNEELKKAAELVDQLATDHKGLQNAITSLWDQLHAELSGVAPEQQPLADAIRSVLGKAKTEHKLERLIGGSLK